MHSVTTPQVTFLIGLPIILTLSTALVFTVAARALGKDLGYLVGFVFYWAWCLGVPLVLLGREGFGSLLAVPSMLSLREHWSSILLLLATVLGAVVMYFIPNVRNVSLWLLVFSPLAIINGTCEEILWRGVYTHVFQNNIFLAVLYPSLGFAISHLSPELVFPAEDGMLGFVISTFFLGLVYGWVAYRTGSATWTALTHSLIGLLAFGEPLSTSVVRLLGL